jgi:flagellar biosynthetic protein FlhB
MASGDRTEKPTGKRRRDARKKGQVARSREVVQVAMLAASVVALGYWGGRIVALLRAELAQALSHTGDAPLRAIGPEDLRGLVFRLGGLLGFMVLPIAGASVLAVITANVAQAGWLVTTEPLAINWARLSPAKGLQRIVSVGGYELLKMLVLVTSLGFLGTWAAQDFIRDTPRLSRVSTASAVLIGWDATDRLLRRSIIVLAIVAAADYAMQRYRLTASLRMTKQEVKDENKQSEGSPEVKGRVRRIQREMFRRRMLTATAHATVVVTNPTHYAVALEYRRSTMAAPRVVAKGRGLLAKRIKDIAREAGVPLIEQVALAQALYKTSEVGDTIPAELFEAVAEVLAYLIRLKQLVLQ